MNTTLGLSTERIEKVLVNQEKILLMDDKEIIRNIVGKMLISLGCEVEFACDGAEAISLYKRAMNNGQPFDLVILDLAIPEGMGGKETIQKLLELNPEVIAVVSSGSLDDPVMANYRRHGFRGMIAKPYDKKALRRVLDKAKNMEEMTLFKEK